mgnify:CR=1 FL=1|jgi:hypothetical protein
MDMGIVMEVMEAINQLNKGTVTVMVMEIPNLLATLTEILNLLNILMELQNQQNILMELLNLKHILMERPNQQSILTEIQNQPIKGILMVAKRNLNKWKK